MWIQQLPTYTYLVIKHYLSFIDGLRNNPNFLVILSLLFTILTMPFAILFLTLCWTYKLLIIEIIKCKVENFAYPMNGLDKFMCISNNCTPCMFLFIKNPNREDLRSKLATFLTKHKLESNARSEKLFFSYDSFLGHYYYYKNNLSGDDYVRLIDEDKEKDFVIRTKDDLAQLVLRYDSDPMPDDNKAVISLTVYPNKIELETCEDTTLICLKMHHCLGDAKAITGWALAELADNKEEPIEESPNPHPVKDTERFADNLKRVLFDDRIKSFPNDMKDRNVLRGYNLREERFICWFSDQNGDTMEKIRSIRKSRPGLTFLDVVNTCITSSLCDYYKKVGSEVPKQVAAGVVLSPAKYSFKYGEKNYKLNNEFSCAGFYLPITDDKGQDIPIVQRLHLIQKEYEEVKRSVDVKFNYWLGESVVDLLPKLFLQLMVKGVELTAGISSLPGPDRFSILGGCEVKDIVLMPPNSPGTGLHFVICSYGSKLRLSVTVDRSVISNYSEAQSLIDNAITHLDVLYKAAKS